MTRRGALMSPWGRKAPRQWLLPAAVVLALAFLPAAVGTAAAPRTSIADVEDEVMCPICGTLLELAESPQAQRERAFVKREIASGKTKDEVKDALVAEYGPDVLALPGSSGFALSAYLVPVVAFVLAMVALALGVRRWRRAARLPSPRPREPAGTGDEDAERLEADLARYDL
jgi:cytochrome c-type biogenesis protein CcmH